MQKTKKNRKIKLITINNYKNEKFNYLKCDNFFLFSDIMSSILIAFCFITSVSGSERYITGSAVYRVNDNEFQELIYKGFVGTDENLVSTFQLGMMVLMVGRYAYEDNKEYVSIKSYAI